MAMRLSYVKSDVARAKAAEAIAGGVIEANADNAAMHAAENARRSSTTTGATTVSEPTSSAT